MGTRWEIRIRCQICSHRYKRVMTAADEATLERLPDPPCPQCKKAQKVRHAPFNGKAPAIGGNITVRAMDQTMRIVSEDHGMTDLRTTVHEGEAMAPKLAPRLQAMADNMFSRPKTRNPSAGIFGLPPQAILKSAVNGRFNTRDTVNPVAIQHAKRESAPIHIIAGDGVRRGG